MNRPYMIASILAFAAPTYGSVDQDRTAIESMAGCYKVTFDFKEIQTAPGHTPSPDYYSQAFELVSIDESDESRISLQHILQVAPTMAIKHWRQQWDFEAQTQLTYIGNESWQTETIPFQQGSWVQRVYQVDDSPRYECSAPWQHGLNSLWQCQTWAPLPRREFSQRADYNILDRNNFHEIGLWGWHHEQLNEKIAWNQQKAMSVGKESGLNTYLKVDPKNCAFAQQWWSEERKSAWSTIQQAWAERIYQADMVIQIQQPSQLRKELNQLVENYLIGNIGDESSLKSQTLKYIEDHLIAYSQDSHEDSRNL